MPRKSIKFDLDFSVKDILPKFKVKQFDDVVLNITTFNNKETYNVGNFKAVIYIACDNDVFMQDNNISVSGNNITINLSRNMLKKHGKAIGEIELTDTVGTITCISFIFDIEGKIGEGASIPKEVEGFVEKYERLILEFKSQVDLCTKNANNLVNETVKKCNTNVDNKLNVVDGLISTKITNLEERFNALTASKQQDAEVVAARDGEVSLNARLERDLANTNRELEKIKKLEESTVSTVTSYKAFTTVSETTQGYFEDVKIEGKTLVNLGSNCRIVKIQPYQKYIELKVSPNTEYTIILPIYRDHTYAVYNSDASNHLVYYSISSKRSVFKFNSNSESNVRLYCRLVDEQETLTQSGELDKNALNIIVLEGDHTDRDVSFFEGLKSVGQGSNDISVSIVNGNLVEYIELNGIIVANGKDYTDSKYVRTNYITVESNQTYYIKRPINVLYVSCSVYFYDSNKSYLGYKDGLTSEFTTVANTKFIRIDMKKADDTINTQEDVNNCDFVVSKYRVSEYIPHQSNKKQILYYNPTTQTWEKPVLREWDSIEKHSDGKYYYHKRSSEVVLNGSGAWKLPVGERWNNKTLTCSFMLKIDGAKGCTWGKYTPRELSSKFSNYGDVELYDSDIEGFTTDNEQGDRVFRVLKTKLSTQDVTGFKAWLQANPVTVVYELAKEEVYECTNLDLITYPNETNLIVNSGAIQPKITLKVLSNVSNIVKLLQEKVSMLENKFIEGLKQVLAGDMMSLAYLLYPQDFEQNEYEVKTLEEL